MRGAADLLELGQLPLETRRTVDPGIRPRIAVGATLICARANVNGRDDADGRNCTLGSTSVPSHTLQDREADT